MDFLQNRAYPFFTEIGKAIAGLLEEENGKLYLPLSSSPEIHDNHREAYLKPNSNFDLALMRYLYGTLVGYADILNEKTAVEHWGNILLKLDIAIEVFADTDVVINDLYSIMENVPAEYYSDATHFYTPKGTTRFGDAVLNCICPLLGLHI